MGGYRSASRHVSELSGEYHHDQIRSSGGAGRRCHRRRDAGRCCAGRCRPGRQGPRQHRQAADAGRDPRPRFRHDRRLRGVGTTPSRSPRPASLTCGRGSQRDLRRHRRTSAAVQRHWHQQPAWCTINVGRLDDLATAPARCAFTPNAPADRHADQLGRGRASTSTSAARSACPTSTAGGPLRRRHERHRRLSISSTQTARLAGRWKKGLPSDRRPLFS